MLEKALFLDRDGVLNFDRGYTHEFKNSDIIEGSAELIKHANTNNYKVIIITNQSGIGRGYYSEKTFHKYMLDMLSYYSNLNAFVDDYFYAPYFKDSKCSKFITGENLRKPNNGMIKIAEKKHRLNLGESILVGDKTSDIEAGHISGIKKLIYFGDKTNKIFSATRFYAVKSLYQIVDLTIW